jgi:hypothetical protein
MGAADLSGLAKEKGEEHNSSHNSKISIKKDQFSQNKP